MDDAGKPIRVLVCDDHRLLTDTLAQLLSDGPGTELVEPPLADPEKAVEAAARHRPDVVLMDVEFGGRRTGIDATRRIKEASPVTNVLIVSGLPQDELLLDAVAAGACGYISKTEAVGDLLAAIAQAARGEILADPAMISRLLQRRSKLDDERLRARALLDRLTPREHEILDLLAAGKRNELIAKELFISAATVQTHVRNMLQKLGVHSKLEAVVVTLRDRGPSSGSEPLPRRG